MNVVRKRFTRWGAGRLAVALAPARTAGAASSATCRATIPPTSRRVPARPTPHRGRACIASCWTSAAARYAAAGDARRISTASRVGTRARDADSRSHPAFATVSTRVIGSNRLAIAAAVARARDARHGRGERGAAPLEGEAARCGVEPLADELVARAERGWRGCVVWGGETTVRRGARSRDADDAAAPEAAARSSRSPRRGVLDDGRRCGRAARQPARRRHRRARRRRPTRPARSPTRASWEAIAAAGARPGARARARTMSYAALDAARRCCRRGATGTNVMDVVIGAGRVAPFTRALAFRLTLLPRAAHDQSSVHRRHHPGLRVVRRRRRRWSRPSRACAKRPRAARRSSA